MTIAETDAGRAAVGNDAYRIPKLPITVVIGLEGGETLEGQLHLLPVAETHDGRERIVEMLARPRAFFPLTGHNDARLVNKDRIVTVSVADPLDAGWVDRDEEVLLDGPGAEEYPEVRLEARVAGIDGGPRTFRGTVRIIRPPGQQRVMDYLNDDRPFFALKLDNTILLINKKYLLDVHQV
jgi:hypothetical protein